MPGIDLHTHLAPDLASIGPAAIPDGGRPIGPDKLYRPDLLESYLDSTGLDEAIVSVPPPFYRQHLPAQEATTWVAALNDGLLVRVAGRPRLAPLAYLPLEHPELALAEYERVAADGVWAGVVACAGGRSVSLADPSLDPLWNRLASDARTVQLHPGHSPDGRLEPFYLANMLGNPIETALAAAQLVFGGILNTYPLIRFVLLHGGGCVPAVAGRWERGHTTARPGVPSLALSPAAALRRFYVDALTHDPAAVDLAVSVFGEDRLVLGSDWPFPMGISDPVAFVAHRGEAYVGDVAVRNAAAALGRSSRPVS